MQSCGFPQRSDLLRHAVHPFVVSRNVCELRRRDSQIPGSGEFDERVLKEAEEQETSTLRFEAANSSLDDVVTEVARLHGVGWAV